MIEIEWNTCLVPQRSLKYFEFWVFFNYEAIIQYLLLSIYDQANWVYNATKKYKIKVKYYGVLS